MGLENSRILKIDLDLRTGNFQEITINNINRAHNSIEISLMVDIMLLLQDVIYWTVSRDLVT